MKKILRKLIQNIFLPSQRINNSFILKGNSIFQEGFMMDLRFPISGKIFLEVGNNSIIEGKFIF
jgi:hypothetical protein